MEIQFQGFSPLISVVVLASLFILVLGISWWSYAPLNSVSRLKKWGLISLRATALALLIVLLLNPYMRFDDVSVRNPEIAVYLDDSRSMNVMRGEYSGSESYHEIIDSFRFEEAEGLTFRFYRFGERVERIGEPVLNLEGSTTNLDEVILHLSDQAAQTEAAILFSDGIITRGRDPLFHARESSVPLFVVPVGDSSRIRDIALTEVLTGETGYLNTRHPVDITIDQNGFGGVRTEIRLLRDGEVLDSLPITFHEESSTQTEHFELLLDEAGLQQFEFVISPEEEEQTVENNRLPFAVEVLDNKTRIAHIAFEIHPDVGAIRNLIQSDQSFEILSRTWLGNRFMEGPLETLTQADPLDLIILHGSISDLPESFQNIQEGVPILQFLTPSRPFTEESASAIPILARSSGPEIPIHLRTGRDAASHPVMELPALTYSRMQPLRTMEISYQIPPTVQRLFDANHEGTETDIPVVFTEETGNIRRTVVHAYGWFRNLQSSTDEVREFTQTLLTNLAAWTSADPDHRNLRINPVKRLFSESEPVRFQASLTNESGEPEPDAVIDVTILNDEEAGQTYLMRNRAGGNYDLEIGNIGNGEYHYQAVARKSGRVLDQQEGTFTIAESNIEYIQTQRNDALLRQIALATSGTVLTEWNVSGLQRELEERALLSPVEERHSDYRYLFEHPAWFLLVVLFLTAEWLLRRSVSLP